MNSSRQKLIRELSALDALLSEYPRPFQDHVIDMVRQMATDLEVFDTEWSRYRAQENTIREDSKRVRQHELRDMPTPSPLHPLVRILEPLMEHELQKVNRIVDIACAEFVHRQIWDEVLEKNPETLKILRSSASVKRANT